MHADRNHSSDPAAAPRDAVRRLFADLPERAEDRIEAIRLMVEEFERVASAACVDDDRHGGTA